MQDGKFKMQVTYDDGHNWEVQREISLTGRATKVKVGWAACMLADNEPLIIETKNARKDIIVNNLQGTQARSR